MSTERILDLADEFFRLACLFFNRDFCEFG